MEELPILALLQKLYKELSQSTIQLDKKWRYSLGLRCENQLLECIEQVVRAKNSSKPMKAHFLLEAVTALELLQMDLRLLLELKLLNPTLAFQHQAKASEVGRMLGGWLKAVQSR